MNPGTILGKYTLVSYIGGGGFGRVYRALQGGPGGFSRPVALKVLRASSRDSHSSVEAFAREARTIARLQHRNIVQVYEFTVEDEQYLLVMELIDGVTLLPLMRPPLGPLPLWLAVAVSQEVCRGLQYAHDLRDEEGRPVAVVHRDIKPSNILLSLQGDVKLTDFGLAKMSMVASDQLTDVGVVKGTPTYMSPEQWRGLPATPASDVFALAGVLYELCTGISFAAASPRGAAGMTRLASPSSLNPQVPAALDSALLGCLVADPLRRPSSAELLETLQRVLLEVAPPAQLSRFAEQLAGWVSRSMPAHPLLEPTSAVSGSRRVTVSGAPLGGADAFAPQGLPGRPIDPTEIDRAPPERTEERARPLSPAAMPAVELGAPELASLATMTIDRSGTGENTGLSLVVPSARQELQRRRRRGKQLATTGLALMTLFAATGLAVWLLADRESNRGHQPDPLPSGRLQPSPSPDGAGLQPDRAARTGGPQGGGSDAAAPVDAGESSPAPAHDLRTRPRPRQKPARPPRAPAGPPGQLSVNTDPWARVFLDGKPIGMTPIFQVQVPSGSHQLKLVGAGGEVVLRRIVVPPAGHLRLGMIRLTGP